MWKEIEIRTADGSFDFSELKVRIEEERLSFYKITLKLYKKETIHEKNEEKSNFSSEDDESFDLRKIEEREWTNFDGK